MSVKDFTNEPCPTCGKDTLHFVHKCRDCGTENKTPYEVRAHFRKKHFLQMKFKPERRAAVRENQAIARKIKREEVVVYPKLDVPNWERPAFGRGREKTKI